MCPVRDSGGSVSDSVKYRAGLAMDLLKQFLESGNFKLLGQEGQSII